MQKKKIVKDFKMERREAIRILMLSPFYFRMTVKQRLELIKNYCREITPHSLS
ncbi:hypothetical protein GMJAKD_14265 [Candidatus Electrothrix aarhusensis]|jgi:hypothetical protein